jgi:hypothetical protein
MKHSALSDLLNAQQLAARWSLSEKTLERWRSLGTGPVFIKLGSRVMYPIAAIELHELNRTRSSSTTTTSQSLAGDTP